MIHISVKETLHTAEYRLIYTHRTSSITQNLGIQSSLAIKQLFPLGLERLKCYKPFQSKTMDVNTVEYGTVQLVIIIIIIIIIINCNWVVTRWQWLFYM